MKNLIKYTLISLASIAILSACTTPNPQYTPIAAGQPETNTVPRFIPDPAIGSISNAVASIAKQVAPANPYAGITDRAIEFGFGLATLIAGGIAARQSKRATANNTALRAVVAGVENASQKGDDLTPALLKSTIQSHAEAAGVETSVLAPVVRSVTS